ncbi:LapD/MoxY N-terminal periplasmic domain-containing protein [Shewanella sp. H8]|uniref:bifunctional diguanylate cyclase/phosphodiesterase n=1 Tax=Shewanella sp. H8 TaxID=3342676 RepID=UPI0033155E5F
MFINGMSLRLQLYLLIVCLSVFSFGAALYNNVSNMRNYLNEQLASHAQGAAHSLGLSISPYMDEEGLVTAETMTNVIFDSGYYQQITFTDLDGKILFKRENPVGNLVVPQWFINWFTLHPPLMTSEVSDGWRIAGQLQVQSHAGTSYKSLWDHAVSNLVSTLFQFVIALLCAYFILKAVLTPLNSIKKQAESVIHKRFEINPIKPFTTELHTVVNAINSMIENIQRSFYEQTKFAEALSHDVYIDSHTGLPNRRALLKKFESIQTEYEQHGNHFYLGLLSMTSLKQVNDNEGYGSGDDYILSGAQLFSKKINNLQGTTLYRISGSEFAFLSLLTEDEAKVVDKQITSYIMIESSSRFSNGFAKHTLTRVNHQESFAEVIKRLDNQLICNQYADNATGLVSSQTTYKNHSREEWVSILTEFTQYFKNEINHCNSKNFSIKCIPLDKIFDLMLQPVIDNNQSILYVESFVRFKVNGEVLSTLDVFAMAERLGVLQELEQAVVCFIFYKLQHIEHTRVAINISNRALHNPIFTDWLFDLYQKLHKTLPPLLYEFNESGAMLSLESTEHFIDRAKKLNIEIAIERFGSTLSSFCYIRNLNIDFIKIEPSYVRDIAQSDTRFFVQTVIQICHGIGIKVIAPQVETAIIGEHFSLINIDGLQGNGLYAVQNFSSIIPINATRTWISALQLNYFNHSPNSEAE